MTKKQSIFQKLLIRYVCMAILPVLIILGTTYYLVCAWCKYNEKSMVFHELNQYVSRVETEKTIAMGKYDYITNNLEILQLLDYSDDDVSTLFDISGRVDSYIKIVNNSSKNTITVFSSNRYLYNSKFISHMRDMKNYEAVKLNLEKHDYMYFEDDLQYDDNGNPYFSLYCKAFLQNETIICIKAYLPELATNDFVISIDKIDAPLKSNAVSLPVSEVYSVSSELRTERLNSQYWLCFLIFLLIALVFFVAIVFIAIRINKTTVARISDFIFSISNDNYLLNNTNFEPVDNEYIELKTLKKALLTLTNKIKDADEEKFKLELEKKILTSNALQSKFNPHLLYNSLSVVMHHAYKNNDKTSFNTFQNLVDYYRLVLAKGNEISTIGNELTLIEKFVRINEIVQYENYNLETDCPEDLKDNEIVHLILQPFVENSIIHGLAGISRKAKIDIKITSTEDFIKILIYDNGFGIPESKLISLKNIDASTKGYGIKNTCERIRLYYGEDASVDFSSKLGEYTEVTILLPKNKINTI